MSGGDERSDLVATPFGHLAIGTAWALVVAERPAPPRWLILGAACAAAADLDFLPGLFVGDPARFHHGASHSVVAAIGLSSLVLWAWRQLGPISWRAVLLVSGAFASHLAADFSTHDPGTRQGLPLAWPFSSARLLAPTWLVPAVMRTWPPTWDWLGHTAWLVLTEVALALPLVVGAWLYADRPRASLLRWGKGETPA